MFMKREKKPKLPLPLKKIPKIKNPPSVSKNTILQICPGSKKSNYYSITICDKICQKTFLPLLLLTERTDLTEFIGCYEC